MKFVTVDCCPVPKKLAPELEAIKAATGCTYASIYRGTAKAAAKYLTGAAPCFKHTQTWIYANYPPGVANPPGYSTHELRSDGVAYPQWTRGGPIPWWACGIDVDDAHVAAVCAAGRDRGWVVTITYPGSSVEYHHVNFRKRPKVHLPALKKGDHGKRVKRLTKILTIVRHPGKGKGGGPGGHPYMNGQRQKFDGAVDKAVKSFQADHHLKPDGVVGQHTRAQLRVSLRRERKHR